MDPSHSTHPLCWQALAPFPNCSPLFPPGPLCFLQELVCYLARLARHSKGCSEEGLAGVMGPVLLAPENLNLPLDAGSLTGAAIWVVQTLVR